jgi:hypothetical protein
MPIPPILCRDFLGESIRATLAQHAGPDPDVNAVVEATLLTWQALSVQLAPVIGARGSDALFGRALRVTSKAYPFLVLAGDHGDGAALLPIVKARLDTCKIDIVKEVSSALLVTFIEHLARLIGEPLTERLTAPVWLSRPLASEKEISR